MHTIDFAELARISGELDAEKPYIELIDGIEVPKVSPKTRHSLLQAQLAGILRGWAGEGGVVGTEWRVWLVPTGPRRSSLVPDVAYVAKERLDPLSDQAYEMPPFAPDIVVEIRSPDDRPRNIARKVDLYLKHGAKVVLDVDPDSRVIVAHDSASTRTFRDGDVFEHPAAPGLTFDLRALFDSVKRRPKI